MYRLESSNTCLVLQISTLNVQKELEQKELEWFK